MILREMFLLTDYHVIVIFIIIPIYYHIKYQNCQNVVLILTGSFKVDSRVGGPGSF